LRPLGRGEGYNFVNAIKGGVIPTKYVPSVDRGIKEAAQKGLIAGYSLEDFEAECYDGSFHAVDSSDIAFKIAGSLAFQRVATQARPVLLEPIIEVEVTTPDEYVGDIMGDITQRRGKVMGMLPDTGRTKIKARVPEAELYKYASALRSITQGRGHHSRSLAGYEPAPEHVAKRVVEERRKEQEA
jgi:elongation factor G